MVLLGGDGCLLMVLILVLDDVAFYHSRRPPLAYDILVEDLALPVRQVLDNRCDCDDDSLADCHWQCDFKPVSTSPLGA
jgi:hypothetical protein